MMLARGANPLTGLPGNGFIQRQIAKMLSQSIHSDVCYIDIDNFKSFNDLHGFEIGDRVIKRLSDIMLAGVKKWESSPFGFAGHIRGDDSIVISRPKNSITICEYITDMFEKMRRNFHTARECKFKLLRYMYRNCVSLCLSLNGYFLLTLEVYAYLVALRM